MRNWVYKQYLQFLVPLKDLKSFFINELSLYGFLFTCSEIQQKFWDNESLISLIRNNLKIIILCNIILGIWLSRKRMSVSCFLERKDVKIVMEVSNIFHYRDCAMIVPTNTTFDTVTDGDFISSKSIQGQYQKKNCKRRLSELDKDIQLSLDEQQLISETLNDRTSTKRNRYEIGTVAKITRCNQHAYFLAVADVNNRGKSENVNMMNVTRTLVSLWEYLQREGHSEPIVIPVITTGRAGLSDGTLVDVIRETITTFAMASQESFVTKKLIISVYPPTLRESNADWDDLCDYLSLKCKFHNDIIKTRDQSQPEGNAIG